MLGPALLTFVPGEWLLGPVGLDRERESDTLCSHSCQVLPQQRYCENCNAFYMIFLYNCFKILTEVIKGCVWTSTRWQGTWNQICRSGKIPATGSSSAQTTFLALQRTEEEVSPCVLWAGQPVPMGEPWARREESRSAVPRVCPYLTVPRRPALSPLDVSLRCATAMAVAPGGDKAGAGAVREAAGYRRWLRVERTGQGGVVCYCSFSYCRFRLVE